MKNTALFLGAAAVLVTALVACVDTTNCPDCGGCGLAGPVNADFLVVSQTGTDNAGAPVVSLATWQEGTCRSDPAPTVWVHYAQGNVTVTAPPEGDEIDASAAPQGKDGVSWTGSTLTMTYEKPDDLSVRMVFVDGATTTIVLCTAGDGAAATCTVEAP